MTCALVAGKYPDYTTIIPKNNSNILRVQRLALLNAAKRISVCSPKGSNQIRFDFSAEGLEISAEDLGFEIAAHEKVECEYNGDDIVIGFNPKFLMDALRVIDDETVDIYLFNPKAPCFIKDADENYIYLILPVNISAAM